MHDSPVLQETYALPFQVTHNIQSHVLIGRYNQSCVLQVLELRGYI